MAPTKIKCVCLSEQNTQNHHLFRKGLRKRWDGLAVDTINIYWMKGEKEVCTRIPIKAYVKVCSECHRLHHPENISYHLNELVVKHLSKVENGNTRPAN